MLIAKRFTFDAAHRMATLPPTHKCHHLHGHTYQVEIIVSGWELDPHGMLIDYDRIAEAWAPVHAMLDHKYLNDILGLERPTTEVVAPWIVCALLEHVPWMRPKSHAPGEPVSGAPCLHAVRVYESLTTWCEVYAADVDYRG